MDTNYNLATCHC